MVPILPLSPKLFPIYTFTIIYSTPGSQSDPLKLKSYFDSSLLRILQCLVISLRGKKYKDFTNLSKALHDLPVTSGFCLDLCAVATLASLLFHAHNACSCFKVCTVAGLYLEYSSQVFSSVTPSLPLCLCPNVALSLMLSPTIAYKIATPHNRSSLLFFMFLLLISWILFIDCFLLLEHKLQESKDFVTGLFIAILLVGTRNAWQKCLAHNRLSNNCWIH